MLRHGLHLLLFLGAFLATLSWIRSEVPDVPKLRLFEQQKDEIDLIFLGSSHVFRQCSPTVFDEERGVQEGEPRSFNMGMRWMGLAEEYYLMQRILAMKPKELRYLIVEGRPFLAGMPGGDRNDFTTRRLEWHDTEITALLLANLRDSDAVEENQWDLARRHAEHWWRRSVNLGLGPEILEAKFQDAPFTDEEWEDFGPKADGFYPLTNKIEDPLVQERRKTFLKYRGRLSAGVKEMLLEDDGGPPDPGHLAFVQRMEALAAEHNVTLIWWLDPGLYRVPGWRQLKEMGEIRYLIAHDDPTRYPDFYQRKNRFDMTHLNPKGSVLLTQFLAQDFMALPMGTAGS